MPDPIPRNHAPDNVSGESSSARDGEAATVASAIARRLTDHGVGTVYCLPGEETIALLDAIEDRGLDLVVCRHEQHAAFMATAHARFTGRPGVLVTTLGPGATNALTGLAQADLCRAPVVMLCGQKPQRNNVEGSFQVLDLVAIASPVTRRARRLDDPELSTSALDASFAAAMGAPSGPALLVIPEDIAGEPCPEAAPPVGAFPDAVVADDVIDSLASRIDAASAPVVLAGAGTQRPDVAASLTRFAEVTGIGVVATQMGKGAIAENHPQSLRCIGQNDADAASLALLDADVVLAVGYHPAEHPPLAWNPHETLDIVHIDRAPPAIERGYQPALSLTGSIASTLERLSSRPETHSDGHRARTAVLREAIVASLDGEHRSTSHPPTALDVVGVLRRALRADDIVCLDNGVYKLWFARQYPALGPNTLVLDNALATMGAGLATAMVAARVHPERRVVAVCGDGGFLMNSQDLIGCRSLPNLTVLILRDDAYGFIKWHQHEAGLDETAVDLANPDFVTLAESFGLTATRVTSDDPLDDVLARLIDRPGPTLIDCPLDQTRNQDLGESRYEQALATLAGDR